MWSPCPTPILTLPADKTNDGPPVGIQITGRPMEEAHVAQLPSTIA